MIRKAVLALALSLFAQPALADPVMTTETCASGWAAFTDLTKMSKYLREAGQIVTDDGWCRIDKTTAALKPHDFDSLTWRAANVAEAIALKVPPQSLEAVFEGILYDEAFNLSFPEGQKPEPGTLRLALFHDPDKKTLKVAQISADFGALGRLDMSGAGSGFDFSSQVAMQMAVGGMRLNAASLTADLTPPLAGALFARSIRRVGTDVELADLVALVPVTSMAAADRAALMAFQAALPEATGKLSLAATSENGFGALQLGSAAWWHSGPESLGKAIELWLSGITISANWAPAE